MDASENLLPDLEMYGIESPERGVCEDSPENRKLLRINGLTWQVIYNEDGTLSPNILAVSPAMLTAKNTNTLENRKLLLTDRDDMDSDYKSGIDLLLLPNADTMVPAWVMSATKYHNRIENERERTARNIEPDLAGPPERCLYVKNDGHRCLLWYNGRNVYGMCRQHLQSTKKNNDSPGMLVERARVRVKQASLAAIDQLENLLEHAESEPVRLQAARDILDRAGIRGGVEIDTNIQLNVTPAEDEIRKRLNKLLKGADVQQALEGGTAEDIQDAEVVEDESDAEEASA
jgi:hypothetical protein